MHCLHRVKSTDRKLPPNGGSRRGKIVLYLSQDIERYPVIFFREKNLERFRFADKRIIITCVILHILGILFCMMRVEHLKPHNMSTYSYCVLVIVWGLSIKRRILDGKVRHRIIASCVFMLLLFFMRMWKHSFFPDVVPIEEAVWYSYYIPMTAIPMFMFMAALRVEPVRDEKRVMIAEKVMLIAEILISIVVMTNGLHGMVFKIKVHPDKDYTHGWFYFVILAWMVIFGLGTFVMLMRKCSLSAAKKYWYIPAAFIAVGLIMLVWYTVNGGSPRIGASKLFHLQEAYCIPFITAMEGIIQTGILAANSGYSALFDYSTINACIFDKSHAPVLSSKGWKDEIDEDHRICSEEVSGGSISWIEDLSTIRRLNAELEEVTEELEAENDLIRQENEVRAERVGYETRNRLYNRIAAAVRLQALKLDELLDKVSEDPQTFKEELVYAAVLGAYIKRMGNLMLLTENSRRLDPEELALAINESLDYLALKGCVCDMQKKGQAKIASNLGLLAYELLEAVFEDTWSRLNSCQVLLDCTEVLKLNIAMDARPDSISSVWKDKQIKEAGGRLSSRYEDDTYYITLEETV